MPKIFCQSCGSPNEYSFQAPKFCCQCATALGGMIAMASNPSVPVTKKSIKPKRRIQVEDDEDEDDEEGTGELVIPDKIDVQVLIDKPQSTKFEEVFASYERAGGKGGENSMFTAARPSRWGSTDAKGKNAEIAKWLQTRTSQTIGEE